MSSGGKEFTGWNLAMIQDASREKARDQGDHPGETGKNGSRPTGRTPSGPAGDPGRSRTGTDRDSVDLFATADALARIEEEARKSGFEAGFADGKREGLAAIESLRDAFISWASRIPEFEMERLRAMVPEMVTLLETAFRRTMGEDLARPEALRRLLERMVSDYAGGRMADLYVPESDFRLLMETDPDFRKDLGDRGVHLEIGPDLADHRVELRFPDRIVSFDPQDAATSFRTTLSRGGIPPAPDRQEETVSGESFSEGPDGTPGTPGEER